MPLLTHHLNGPYAITDRHLLPNTTDLLHAVEQALRGGVRIIQYREKTPDPSQLLDTAKALVDLCHRHNALLIINDHLDLALRAGADGVHLGLEDASLEAAIAAGGPNFVVGATCHDRLDLALKAVALGAHYVAFGRFFPSSTKPDAPAANLGILTEARATLPVPVVAIGGINLDNAALALRAGADMVAVVQAVFGTPDTQAAAEAFCTLIHQHSIHRQVSREFT